MIQILGAETDEAKQERTIFTYDPLITPLLSLDDNSADFSLPDQFRSKEWRMEHLYWIENEYGAVVRFKMKPFQAYLLKNFHFLNIILKARQLGFSTFIAIFFLDDCLFNRNMKAAIVADKKENGQKIFKKIEFAWDHLDKSVKSQLNLHSKSDSTTQLEFSNDSLILVGTTIHSGTYQRLHVSELGPLCAASPEKADDVLKSALPTVPDASGLVFIESTAEGEGNEFHMRCMEAMDLQKKIEANNKLNPDHQIQLSPMEYKFFFFPWFEDPKYAIEGDYGYSREIDVYFKHLEHLLGRTFTKEQKMWYAMKAKAQKKRMKEQYPSTPEEAFLSSGNKLFDGELINKKLERDVREPLEMLGDLYIYRHYQPNHRYGLGADCSLGSGNDSSTIVVIDFTLNEVVATYASKTIEPYLFAYEIAKVGRMYGNCIVAPEANPGGGGHTVCIKLLEIYSEIYRYEIKGYEEVTRTIRLGWLTNVSTKPRMMYELSEAFGDDVTPLIIPDTTILMEARLYNKEDTLITTTISEMRSTRHFDLLTACAIAWQMRSQAAVSMASPEQMERIERSREGARTGKKRFE